MKEQDSFSGCHPAVGFLYFSLVLVFSMCFLDPLSLAISLVVAVWYSLTLNGVRGLRFQLWVTLPILLFAVVVNPLFNHRGATILAYFPSGNPLTLESVLYGLAAAVMLCAVVTWFSCYTAVMTSDKFVYLFGRVIPALSLVLSMTLRFVPRFRRQFRAVMEGQRSLGRDHSRGSLWRRMKGAVTVFSIMVTWSLENAIETGDSMKSRGYGLPGRTAYSIYRLDRRDVTLLLWLALGGGYIVTGWALGGLAWTYYPTAGGALTGYGWSVRLVYLALCLTPILLNGKEARTWKRLRSAA